MDIEAPIARVSAYFLSVAIDSAQLVGGSFWTTGADRLAPFVFDRPRLRRMAAALAPAYLRVGGTDADRIYYDLSDAPIDTAPEGYAHVLNAERWRELAAFASELGFELVFTLNAGPGPRDPRGHWLPDQARRLIEHARDRGDPVAVWELGNEPNAYPLFHGMHVPPGTLAGDAARARALLDEIAPGSRLAAPATAYLPLAGEVRSVTAPFLAAGGGEAIDILTWHYYPLQSHRCPAATRRASPGDLLVAKHRAEVGRWAERVEAARDRHAPGLGVWLGETGSAQCGGQPGISDAFESSLWWLDQLGRLARRGQPVVVRHVLSGADYGLIDDKTLAPRPDYFASLLWKQLMGRRVLRVRSSAGPRLAVYAHCARAAPARPPGAVAVLAINFRDRPAAVSLDLAGSERAEIYRVTAEGLASREVRLNGAPLRVSATGAPPTLEPTAGDTAFPLAARSYAFAVVPNAAAAACP